GGGATAARLILCVRELLATDGIQGQLLHSLRLSPRGTRWRLRAHAGACLIHATRHVARLRRRCFVQPQAGIGVDLLAGENGGCSPIRRLELQRQDPVPIRFHRWFRSYEVASDALLPNRSLPSQPSPVATPSGS